MAYVMLFFTGELCEGFVKLGNEEKGIVSESALSRKMCENGSVSLASNGELRSVRKNTSDRAYEISGAVFEF